MVQDSQYFLSLCGMEDSESKGTLPDDGLPTQTSEDQEDVEDRVAECYRSFGSHPLHYRRRLNFVND